MSLDRGSLIRRRIVDRAYRHLVACGEARVVAHVSAELPADAALMCSRHKRERGETAWMIAKRILTTAGDDFGVVR